MIRLEEHVQLLSIISLQRKCYDTLKNVTVNLSCKIQQPYINLSVEIEVKIIIEKNELHSILKNVLGLEDRVFTILDRR